MAISVETKKKTVLHLSAEFFPIKTWGFQDTFVYTYYEESFVEETFCLQCIFINAEKRDIFRHFTRWLFKKKILMFLSASFLINKNGIIAAAPKEAHHFSNCVLMRN